MPDQRFDPRNNSIGFLRLFLALLVLYWHAVLIGQVGVEPLSWFSGEPYTLGGLGVDGFFVISGWLIAASFQRTNSVRIYCWHRCLRIFPGYWICILASAIVLPLLFGQSPNLDYFSQNFVEPFAGVFLPVVKKVFNLQVDDLNNWPWVAFTGKKTIDGVFNENVEQHVINGSLWTLAFEFRMYVLIGVLGAIRLIRKPIIIPLLIVSWCWFAWTWYQQGPMATMLPRTTAHFLMGTTFYLWNPPFRRGVAVISLIVAMIAMRFHQFAIVAPFTTGYIVFYLARVLPFQRVGQHADFSYGVYIYGYPLQQTLAAFHWNEYGLIPYLFLSVTGSILMACGSWYLVESQALKLKNWGPGRRTTLVA